MTPGPARSSAIGAVALLLAGGCGENVASPSPAATTPPARVVYVVLTPTRAPVVEPTWTPEPEMLISPSPTARVEAFPTLRPTVDLAEIPSLERAVAPPPGSRHDQLAECVTFSAEPLSQPAYAGQMKTRVKVKARNRCNTGVPSDDSWFEIRSYSYNGVPIGREVGRFQAPIAPFAADAETLIEIDCPPNQPGGCRYEVEVWWAAGGGRKAQ